MCARRKERSDGIAYCYSIAVNRVECPLCGSKWGETREEGVVIYLDMFALALSDIEGAFHEAPEKVSAWTMLAEDSWISPTDS